MPDHQHYSNSPIIESIIEIRTSRTEREVEAAVADFRSKIAEAYGDEQPHLDVAVNLGPGDQMTSSRRLDGSTFRTSDNRQIAGVYTDRFLYRRMAPYDCWETFRAEAQRLWLIYRETFNPATVGRLGLRYVNRFAFPVGSELKDYLNFYPELAGSLPQGLDGFLIRVQIPQPEITGISLLTCSTNQSDAETVYILLDIDLVTITDLPQDTEAVWNLMEQFHDKQNETFRACITPKTEDLIK